MDMSRWLGLRLDLLACVFLAATAFTLAGTRSVLDPSLAGLSLVYAMNLTGLFQWMTRQSAEVENFSTASEAADWRGAQTSANPARALPTRMDGARLVVSVERMLAYTRLTPEAPPVTDVRPPAGWPTAGHIVVRNLSLMYPSTGHAVLKGGRAFNATNGWAHLSRRRAL